MKESSGNNLFKDFWTFFPRVSNLLANWLRNEETTIGKSF